MHPNTISVCPVSVDANNQTRASCMISACGRGDRLCRYEPGQAHHGTNHACIDLPFLVLVVDGVLFLVAAAIPALVLVYHYTLCHCLCSFAITISCFFFHAFAARTCELYTIIPKDGIIM